jgi:hypothetical protein
MIRDQAGHKREKLVSKLPVTGELLRGSLLERTIRHTKGCPNPSSTVRFAKCLSGKILNPLNRL